MKRVFQKIVSWFKRAVKAITPGNNALEGAAKGLLVSLALLLILYSIMASIKTNDVWLLLFILGFTALFILLAYGVNWGLKLLVKIPKRNLFALVLSFCVLSLLFSDELAYTLILTLSVLGASLYALFKTKFRNLSLVKKLISLLGFVASMAVIVVLVVYYIRPGIDIQPMINAAFTSESVVDHISLASPAIRGEYEVKTLYYGSGKDRHRAQFGEDVDLKTDAINGVAFLDNWEGISGWWRTKYWGFDAKSLPLNAQVWYPDGEGPFPLVLVVHGNHSMQDYSDPGYAYLGELLASRGMIVASVDENFVNGSWSDEFTGSLSKENDARGWILLEHLRQWHEWNGTQGNPFYQKVDIENLSLIGHSRGGEAVGHAALLNTLPYYSDDATIKLGYNYQIKSIIAIAPVDGQYKPGGSRTALENINYFVIHGSQDGDVSSFAGNRQFDRIQFTDSSYNFKAGLYVHGANHGQFNTSWGNNDVGTPFTRLLNLKQMLKGEDQREIAKVYISAFLEATLRNDKRYLSLFTDFRTGKNWLPETIYLSQFQDSNTELIANFEEDFDVTTLATTGTKVFTKNLSVWKEKKIPMKWGSKDSRGLFLGWHYHKKDIDAKKNDTIYKDSLKTYPPVQDSLIASYTIRFQDQLKHIDSTSVFVFSMAESKESSNPKAGGKWIDQKKEKKANSVKETENSKNKDNENSKEEVSVNETKEEKTDEKEEQPKAKEPIDFSILLTDNQGSEIYFPLSKFSKLQRRIGVKVWKQDYFENEKSENVMQLFSYRIGDLKELNDDFDFTNLKEIRFVFDRTDKGVVVIDDIGFMKDLKTLVD